MKLKFRHAAVVFGLGLSLLGSAWASGPTGGSGHWRSATVTAVVARSEVPADVHTPCLGGRDLAAAARVVVVRTRVDRVRYTQAVPLQEGLALQVGDAVFVDSDRCVLQLAEHGRP